MKFRFSLLPQPGQNLTEEGKVMIKITFLNHMIESMAYGIFFGLVLRGYEAVSKDYFDRYHAGEWWGLVGFIAVSIFIVQMMLRQNRELTKKHREQTEAIESTYRIRQARDDEYDPFGGE